MLYYRTKKDIAQLAGEIQDFTHRSQIGDFIPRKHPGMVEIGLLSSVMKDTVWFGRGSPDTKTHQLRVNAAVMDFIMNEGLFDDAVNRKHLVRVYGRTENGRLADVVAYNMHSLDGLP